MQFSCGRIFQPHSEIPKLIVWTALSRKALRFGYEMVWQGVQLESIEFLM